MINSKKWLVLCVIGLVSFGTIREFVSTSVFSAQKNGSTQIISSAREEIEWGLSVPNQVILDKDAKTSWRGNTIVFGICRVAIVSEDGSYFQDSNKNHIFTIVPTAKGKFIDPTSSTLKLAYRATSNPQGMVASVEDMDFADAYYLSGVRISTRKDGSNPAPFAEYQIGTLKTYFYNNFTNTVSDTVSWTVIEEVFD